MSKPNPSTNRNYLIACVYSWAWHLLYGMWRGYRETRTYGPYHSLDGARGQSHAMIALTSTDDEHRIVKVFWELP